MKQKGHIVDAFSHFEGVNERILRKKKVCKYQSYKELEEMGKGGFKPPTQGCEQGEECDLPPKNWSIRNEKNVLNDLHPIPGPLFMRI